MNQNQIDLILVDVKNETIGKMGKNMLKQVQLFMFLFFYFEGMFFTSGHVVAFAFFSDI